MTKLTALDTLESSDDQLLLLSCRDGAAFFDQLRLANEMREYVGGSSVTVWELRNLDLKGARHAMQEPLTLDELRGFFLQNVDVRSDPLLSLYPLGLVWPMGHSWSAAVAQHVMTGTCIEAGVADSKFLTDEHHLADAGRPAVGAAVDDANLFERSRGAKSEPLGRSILEDLDDVSARHGILSKDDKKIDKSLNGVVLGMQLADGKFLLPKQARLLDIVVSLTDLQTQSLRPSKCRTTSDRCNGLCWPVGLCSHASTPCTLSP